MPIWILSAHAISMALPSAGQHDSVRTMQHTGVTPGDMPVHDFADGKCPDALSTHPCQRLHKYTSLLCLLLCAAGRHILCLTGVFQALQEPLLCHPACVPGLFSHTLRACIISGTHVTSVFPGGCEQPPAKPAKEPT